METIRRLTLTVITALFVVTVALLWASASPKVTGQTAPTFALQTSPTRELSLEERITYQQRVENVYWQHQIWGKENHKPRPALEEVMPDAAIRAKAEDAVRRSLALEKIWQRPLTPEQLQAEMERMARDTKNAGLLRE